MHAMNRYLIPQYMEDAVGMGERGMFDEDIDIAMHLWERMEKRFPKDEVGLSADYLKESFAWGNWCDTLNW